MAKEAKTNAMRMLDRKKVPYEAFSYVCDEFIDGLHSADLIGAPYAQSFKTLVMEGKAAAIMFLLYPLKKRLTGKRQPGLLARKQWI